MMRAKLVGREAELAVLNDCLIAALEGRPQLVVCQGEPGIGKTRLADELVASATAMRALCVWGLAADSSGAPPYWPWWQVLRALANTVDLAAIARRRRLNIELSGVAPDVFGPDDAAQESRGSPEDRFRQFDAVARLLREVCRQTPLVIVLDDVHWADKPTLLLLQHVARSLTDERLLLVANTRVSDQQHGEVLARLVREPVTTLITLHGLDSPAIREQLATLVGDEVSAHDVAEVQALTGGNPFYVGEVARALADKAAGRRHAPVTPTLRFAVADRLAQLSPEAVTFLQAASIVGREFQLSTVALVTELSTTRCLAVMDEAGNAGLVEAGGGPDAYRFAHALVCDAIDAALPAADRVALHRRAAHAIEKQYTRHWGPHVFDIARHWAACAVEGDRATAAAWLARAGEEAMRQLAYEEAARLFRQAVETGGADLDDEGRCRLLLSAGRALHLSGDFASRLQVCLDAAALAREMDRPDLLAEAALLMEAVGQARFELATRRLCEEALARLDPEPTALRARVTAAFVETFIYTRDIESVAPASVEALEIATRCGDPGALAVGLRARRAVRAGPEGLQERMDLAARMSALSRETGERDLETAAHLWQIDASLEDGDFNRVAAEIEALARCAEEVRGPLARFEVSRCRAVLAQAQGRFADARRLESEAFAILDPTDNVLRYMFRSALLPVIGRHVGQDDAAIQAILLAGAPEGTMTEVGLIAQVATAHTLVTAHRLDAAAGIYHALGPVADWRPPPHVTLLSSAMGISVAVALGLSADVATLRERLNRYRGHHVVSGTSAMAYFGPVELWLGVAAHHLGRPDDAEIDLDQADRACAASGALAFRVEAQYELARVLADRSRPGDADRARSLLTAAARSAEALGMTPFVESIAAAARDAPRAAPTPRPSSSSLVRDGDLWIVQHDGVIARLRDSKGMRYLAELIAHPGMERHALDLVGLTEGAVTEPGLDRRQLGDAGAVLDEQSKAAYKRRLLELREDMEEAEVFNDVERAARAGAEIDALAAELARAVGLGGRDRRAASTAERARLNVTRALRAAIARIEQAVPDLGRHLGRRVRTGLFCAYEPTPDDSLPWS